jgi:hypothetical protein
VTDTARPVDLFYQSRLPITGQEYWVRERIESAGGAAGKDYLSYKSFFLATLRIIIVYFIKYCAQEISRNYNLRLNGDIIYATQYLTQATHFQ